jgi:hypothetical protein
MMVPCSTRWRWQHLSDDETTDPRQVSRAISELLADAAHDRTQSMGEWRRGFYAEVRLPVPDSVGAMRPPRLPFAGANAK